MKLVGDLLAWLWLLFAAIVLMAWFGYQFWVHKEIVVTCFCVIVSLYCMERVYYR